MRDPVSETTTMAFCQSHQPALPQPIPPRPVAMVPDSQAAIVGQGICGRLAAFHNLSLATPLLPNGPIQPSLCIEGSDYYDRNGAVVHVPTHTALAGPVPVCVICKFLREQQWEWKKSHISLGVCHKCRQWAKDNMEPTQNDCTCPYADPLGPMGRSRYRHLCQEHETLYWEEIRTSAQDEIDHRQRLSMPRKRGNNWTHRKQRGPRPRVTPDARRDRARTLPRNRPTPPGAIASCFCGEAIGNVGHSMPAGSEYARIRSCAGCNGFMRHW